MTVERKVTCINKPDRYSSHEHITHIGDATSNPTWRIKREQAVEQIESGTQKFYTLDRSTGAKVYVGVVREHGKLPYLRTQADGKWNDNLLALPECSH